MNKWMIALLVLIFSTNTFAQGNVDIIKMPNISGVKVFMRGDQMAYPLLTLNSADQFELHFDDLDGRVKNFYAGFELCNADWTPANLSTFDYIKGFSQSRITQYRVSSIAFTKYIHYSAVLPDRNAVPTKRSP